MNNLEVDTRWVAFLIWGVGTVAAYLYVVILRARARRYHRDARSKRDLIEAGAYFIVALCASMAITLALFGEPGTNIRQLLTAVALGAFTAAGVYMATERPPGRE